MKPLKWRKLSGRSGDSLQTLMSELRALADYARSQGTPLYLEFEFNQDVSDAEPKFRQFKKK